MTTFSNIKVNRTPAFALSTSTAPSEDLSLVLSNPTAFASRAEFMDAVQTAAIHIANQVGLK